MYYVHCERRAHQREEDLIYIVWNTWTQPRRITFVKNRTQKDGKWIICEPIERETKDRVNEPTATTFLTPPVVIGSKLKKYLPFSFCVSDALLSTESDTGSAVVGARCELNGSYHLMNCTACYNAALPKPILEFDMCVGEKEKDSDTAPLLFIRTFERQPLREDRYGPWKWNHVGDVAMTELHFRSCTLLPSFITADMYVRKGLLEPHQWIFACRVQHSPPSVLPLSEWVHTPPFLLEDVAKIKKEWIEPELSLVHSLVWSRDIQVSVPNSKDKITTPMNYRINAFPLLDPAKKGEEEDENIFSLRSLAGLSAQSPWYHDRDRPAVSSEWILEHLQDVWKLRGWTREKWLDVVQSMVVLSAANETTCVWSTEQHDCLASHVRLVELHCTTRPYNYDHQMFDSEGSGAADWKQSWKASTWTSWVGDDYYQKATLFPGDCEDSASASYSIGMTVLFPPQTEKWVQVDPPVMLALRQLAAIVGFPCGICGTGADPYNGKSEGGGHMYAAMIPFTTLYRAMTGQNELPAAVRNRFKVEFNVDVPMHHTKPAIIESILYATPYYSDHHGVSARKQHVLDLAFEWVNEHEGKGRYEWNHYSATHPMNKRQCSQGHAFRIFTDAHLQLFPEGLLIIQAGKSKTKSVAVSKARSFVPYQGKDTGLSQAFDAWFPGWKDAIGSKKDVAEIRDRVLNSFGYGLPIELLSHGNKKPLFQLHATVDPSDELVRKEKRIIRTYEYPIVTLPSSAIDLYAEEAMWVGAFLQYAKTHLHLRYANTVPRASNDRVTVFVYDLVQNPRPTREGAISFAEAVDHLMTLATRLGAIAYTMFPYGWSIACTYHLTTEN